MNWRDLSQADLDKAYDQAAYAPNMGQVVARYGSASERARARLGTAERFAYGPGDKEGVDIYRTAVPEAPVHVFIHGGAWRATMAADYAFLAEMFVAAGAVFVAVDFDWVQDCEGDLSVPAEQTTRALAWVRENAARFGGDPERIHISAHSSGAHLAAVALTRLPPFSSALLVSGIYDLAPVRQSSRSSYVHLTDETEAALSPIRHLNGWATPTTVAVGELETPEFLRQSAEFADALGSKATNLVVPHLNHFEILETLGNPFGFLGRIALDHIGAYT